MAVTAKLEFGFAVDETLSLSETNVATEPTIQHKTTEGRITLNASSTAPATKVWSEQITLGSGTHTIDLTSLSRSTLSTVDMTGLKVQAVKIFTATDNTEDTVFTVGASNGYHIFGGSAGKVTMVEGAYLEFYFPEGLADVSSTVKTIDVSSSDADAIFDIMIVAG